MKFEPGKNFEDDLHHGFIYFKFASKHILQRYLSNFYPAKVVYKGVAFPSIEHAFQAAKYLLSNKPEAFKSIAHLKTAREAKSAGSKSGMKKRGAMLDVVRWNELSTDIMRQLVESRVKHDAVYRKILKAARKKKIKLYHFESACGKRGGKPFWGGYFKAGSREWFGTNMLGEIMMSVKL